MNVLKRCLEWFEGKDSHNVVYQPRTLPPEEKRSLFTILVLAELNKIELPGKYRKLLRNLVFKIYGGSCEPEDYLIGLDHDDLENGIRIFEEKHGVTIQELSQMYDKSNVLLRELFEIIHEDRL